MVVDLCHCRNWIFRTVIFILAPTSVLAQKGKWEVSVAANAGLSFTKDELYSSAVAKASVFGGSMEIKWTPGKSLHRLVVQFLKSNPAGDQNKFSGPNESYFTAEYANLFSILPEASRVQFSLGPAIQFLSTSRSFPHFLNSGRHQNLITSLGLSLWADYWTNEDKKWRVSGGLDMPLLSLVNSSSNDAMKSAKSGSDLTTISEFLRLKTSLALSTVINGGNQVSISYGWDYIHLKQIWLLTQAKHELSLGFIHTF